MNAYAIVALVETAVGGMFAGMGISEWIERESFSWRLFIGGSFIAIGIRFMFRAFQ